MEAKTTETIAQDPEYVVKEVVGSGAMQDECNTAYKEGYELDQFVMMGTSPAATLGVSGRPMVAPVLCAVFRKRSVYETLTAGYIGNYKENDSLKEADTQQYNKQEFDENSPTLLKRDLTGDSNGNPE